MVVVRMQTDFAIGNCSGSKRLLAFRSVVSSPSPLLAVTA